MFPTDRPGGRPQPPAPEREQHTSGDLSHPEDAPEPGQPPTADTAGPQVDESLPADAAEESREKWWESEADADEA
ncbi:hypothetical protein [Mariniluteicoccus flavus]